MSQGYPEQFVSEMPQTHSQQPLLDTPHPTPAVYYSNPNHFGQQMMAMSPPDSVQSGPMWVGVAPQPPPANFGHPAAPPAAPPAATKRKVSSNACVECNRKKTRCDRDATNPHLPCAGCTRSGKDCVMKKSARGGKRVKGQVKGVMPWNLPRGREERGEGEQEEEREDGEEGEED
ncbi:hypothetical protein OCU04_011273 [Sclerotinia nivalis]|uniref:Zn(2)-C6 fungal-type domain-containing protein n=1 Tax=Sclerotinia nivalis TaxID=352851 RepID=A0A9X0ABG2_9HELO|nr:hypothetical protein OCU04_011273 [Sclerotinia nivalis]